MLDVTASCSAAGEHLGIDVDHDFMASQRKGRGVARLEHPLGHPHQRIGAAHGAGGAARARPMWDVLCSTSAVRIVPVVPAGDGLPAG